MAERQSMCSADSLSFLLPYNGGHLHSELVCQMQSLMEAEAAAIRGLSSLGEIWPVLNSLYGMNSLWQKMKVLDEAISDSKVDICFPTSSSRPSIRSSNGPLFPELCHHGYFVIFLTSQAAGLRTCYRFLSSISCSVYVVLQARENVARKSVAEAGRKTHPLNAQDSTIAQDVKIAEDLHLGALQVSRKKPA